MDHVQAMQPSLTAFESHQGTKAIKTPEQLRMTAGRSLCKVLRRIRREMPADLALPLNNLISEVARLSAATDRQIEDAILYAIEKESVQWAIELSEHTGFSPEFIRQKLAALEARGLIYEVNRYVPGSGRPQYMFKSTRIANVESSGGMVQPVGNNPYKPSDSHYY